MTEKRAAPDLRLHAQDLYAALRMILDRDLSQVDLVIYLKQYPTLDTLLQMQPNLVPAVLDLAWNLRFDFQLSPFFQGAAKTVVEEKTSKISPVEKSFSEIVTYLLHSALRLRCEYAEKSWLTGEDERLNSKKPPGKLWLFLLRNSLLGPLAALLKKYRDRRSLRYYPSRGIFDILKRYLKNQSQFEFIHSLTLLKTNSAQILGSAILGLNNTFAIECLADLYTKKLEFVIQLARLFSSTLIEYAEGVTQAGGDYVCPLPQETIDKNRMGELTGNALSEIGKNGLHVTRLLFKHRDDAKDVVRKGCVYYGQDVWKIFLDPEQVERIAACPISLAKRLGRDCLFVPIGTSRALSALPKASIMEDVFDLLYAKNPEGFRDWSTNRECVAVWVSLVADIRDYIKKNRSTVPSEWLKQMIIQYEHRFLEKGKQDLWLEAAKRRTLKIVSPSF